MPGAAGAHREPDRPAAQVCITLRYLKPYESEAQGAGPTEESFGEPIRTKLAVYPPLSTSAEHSFENSTINPKRRI